MAVRRWCADGICVPPTCAGVLPPPQQLGVQDPPAQHTDTHTHTHMQEKLSVSNNHLSALPDTLVGCTKLNTIHASHNKMCRLPEVLPDALVELLASHNRITVGAGSRWGGRQDMRSLVGLRQGKTSALFAQHQQHSCLMLEALWAVLMRAHPAPASCTTCCVCSLVLPPPLVPQRMACAAPSAPFGLRRLQQTEPSVFVLPTHPPLRQDIPTSFGRASKLTTLLLDSNQISDVPEEVGLPVLPSAAAAQSGDWEWGGQCAMAPQPSGQGRFTQRMHAHAHSPAHCESCARGNALGVHACRCSETAVPCRRSRSTATPSRLPASTPTRRLRCLRSGGGASMTKQSR